MSNETIIQLFKNGLSIEYISEVYANDVKEVNSHGKLVKMNKQKARGMVEKIIYDDYMYDLRLGIF